ncbi:MAG: hypothetical protein JXA69_17035 [Phycisphaerae bacterium]|nr:hypothetical protein [Phycisphaerae bacterium]
MPLIVADRRRRGHRPALIDVGGAQRSGRRLAGRSVCRIVGDAAMKAP